MISVYEKAMDWQKWEKIFKLMENEGVQPTHVSYGAMICWYTKGKQHERGMDLFKQMTKAGVVPDRITWNTVFHLCEKT